MFFYRPLHLDLQRDPSVFHQDLVIEDSHGAVHYDTSSVYTGTLKGKSNPSIEQPLNRATPQ